MWARKEVDVYEVLFVVKVCDGIGTGVALRTSISLLVILVIDLIPIASHNISYIDDARLMLC